MRSSSGQSSQGSSRHEGPFPILFDVFLLPLFQKFADFNIFKGEKHENCSKYAESFLIVLKMLLLCLLPLLLLGVAMLTFLEMMTSQLVS